MPNNHISKGYRPCQTSPPPRTRSQGTRGFREPKPRTDRDSAHGSRRRKGKRRPQARANSAHAAPSGRNLVGPGSQRTPLPGARPVPGPAQAAPGRRQSRPNKLLQTRARWAARRATGGLVRGPEQAQTAGPPLPPPRGANNRRPRTKAAPHLPAAAPTPRPPRSCWRLSGHPRRRSGCRPGAPSSRLQCPARPRCRPRPATRLRARPRARSRWHPSFP